MARRILWAALLLGGIRFLFLGSWSLWLDEAYTLADSRHGALLANPLGYLLFGGFYDLVGGRPSELELRLPAAVLGWLCLPVSAWALRPFVGSRGAACVALLLALSPWHVYWSQNARFYTFAQLLGLFGGGWVFRGLQRDRAAFVFSGVLALGAAALVHPSATVLAAAFVCVPWLLRWSGLWPRREGDRRGWWILAASALIGAGLGAPWVLDVWQTWEERQGEGNPRHFLLSTGYFVTPLVCLGAVYGLVTLLRERRREANLLVGVVLVSALLTFAASFLLRVSAQYVFVLQPWLLGLAVAPVRAGGGPRLEARASVLLALLVLPLSLETALYFTARHGDRPRWKEAYAHVFEHRGDTDLVLGMEAPVGEYYLSPSNDDLRHWEEVILLDRFRSNVPVDWMRYGRRMWLVINREQLLDWLPADRERTVRMLEEDCSLEARFEVPYTPRDLDVWVYRLEP